MNAENKPVLIDVDESIDTSLPTDVSISHDDISELLATEEDLCNKRKSMKNSTRTTNVNCNSSSEFVEGQLSKMNMQIKEKNLLLEKIRSDLLQKVEELELKLGRSLRENEMLKMQLNLEREESKRIKQELEVKLTNIESKQSKLATVSSDVQRLLTRSSSILTDVQYERLTHNPHEDISILDYISLKIYEREKDYVKQIEKLRAKLQHRNEDIHLFKVTQDKLTDELENEKHARMECEFKLDRCKKFNEDLKSQIEHDNYKVDNYNQLFRDKEEIEIKYADVLKQFETASANQSRYSREKEEIANELTSVKQSLSIVMQDKEYLSKLSTELQTKFNFSQDKKHQYELQVDRMKQAREELYEKYIVAREQYRKEYDEKLKQELDQVKVQMNAEINRLKNNTKDISEREIRSLREARDLALNEKNLAVMSEKETMNKYEQLLLDSRQRQLTDDSRVGDLQNLLKMKSFELERIHMLLEEAHNSQRMSQQSYEKLQKKMDVLTREYYNMQMALERKTNDLENQLKEKVKLLQTYEQLEDEMDQLVLQAAELADDKDSERMVATFSQSTKLPVTIQRRITQCVSLARRVIEMERINTQMKLLLEKEVERVKHLSQELTNMETLKHDVRQPHTYLMQKIQERDDRIQIMEDDVTSLNKLIDDLKKENSELKSTNRQMGDDLQKLLNQGEELSSMKKVISDLEKKSTENISNNSHPPSKQHQTRTALKIHYDEPEKDRTSAKHHQDLNNAKKTYGRS